MFPASMCFSRKHASRPNVCVVKERVFLVIKWQDYEEPILGSVEKSMHYSEILDLEMYRVTG